jgi:predicted DCC family thiol-disulfide oxidoreductase YuxK
VSAKPSQEPGLIERYGLTRSQVDRSVWVIEPDGRRLRGARGVARVLPEMGGCWRPLAWLVRLPGAGSLGYAVVARTRGRLSALWGDPPPYG